MQRTMPHTFAPHRRVSPWALSVVLVLSACSRLDRETNCLNEKARCFRADKTAPAFVSSNPAPSAIVSRLTTLTVVFSEELKEPKPADISITGAGKGQLTLASITQTAANTYTLVFSPDTVANGNILIDFSNLRDYNNNTVNYALPLVGNVDIEIQFDISLVSNPGYRRGVSNGGGYTTTAIKWQHSYTDDASNSWDMRVTTGAVDCNSGTSYFTGTGLAAATDVLRTFDRLTHFGAGAGSYRVVVCVNNATMNKKGIGSLLVVRDDTPPTATYAPLSDDYNLPKTMMVSCSDNADKVAITQAQLAPWDANPMNPANPADPDFDTSGNVTVGQELVGGHSITNPTNPTRTKVRFRCIDIAGNKSTVGMATYLIDNTLPEVTVNLDSNFRQFVSVTGYTTTTLSFTTNQTGTQYRIVKNATSCAALDGTSVIGPGPFTTPPAGPHVINASALDVGVNNIRICVSNVGATKWGAASLSITRDDTIPFVTPSVTSGSYGAVQVVNLTCSPNPDKVAITTATQPGASAPPPPADPNIDANGNILFGNAATQFVTPDAATSTIKWQCITRSGNRSVVDGSTTATYTVDSILPTVTLISNSHNFVSNATGAFNFTDLTFQVSRANLNYAIKAGSSFCTGGTTLASGTVATAGQDITVRLNTPAAGPPTHFGAVGSYDLRICVPNYVGAVGYSTTSLSITRDDTPPAAVSALTITETGSGAFTLNWSAATDTGGAGIWGYRIYRSTTAGDYSAATLYSSTTNSVNVSGLNPAITYYFVVRALDNSGNLSTTNSNEVKTRTNLSVSVSGLVTGEGSFQIQQGSETLVFSTGPTETRTFGTVFAPGNSYSISITGQPQNRNCAFVNNQYGTISGDTTLQVECIAGHLVSGAMTVRKMPKLNVHLYRATTQILAGGGSGSQCSGSNNTNCYNGVGAGARFHMPHGITAVNNALYIADRENNRIRRYEIPTTNTTTFAGEGSAATLDGMGLAAQFNKPQAITTDGVHLYVIERPLSPDYAYIRRIHIATQQVTTIAGGGSVSGGAACPGVAQANCRDGSALQALFGDPNDIKFHNGSLYIADFGNNRIRRFNLATGQVTTIAGNGNAASVDHATGTEASFNNPSGLVIVGNSIYVVDYNGHRIRAVSLTAPHAVTTVAGSGTSGHADGPAATARFSNPDHVFSDGYDLYLTEYANHRLRRVDLGRGVVSTLAGRSGTPSDSAGTGTQAAFDAPVGITSDGRRLYVMSYTGGRLFRVFSDSLAGYWPLAGDYSDYNASLLSVNDLSAIGGSPAPVSGRYGEDAGALRFTGSERLEVAASLGAGTCGVSLSIWARATGVTGSGSALLSVGTVGSNGYGVFMDADGKPFMRIDSYSSDPAIGVPIYNASAFRWRHLALVCTGTMLWTLYVDGRPVNAVNVAATPPSALVQIGGTGLQNFTGALAAARIYARSLTEGEIAELAQDASAAEVGPSYNTAASGLLVHYTFSGATVGGSVGNQGALAPLSLNASGSPAVSAHDKDGNATGAYDFTGAQNYSTSSSTGLPLGMAPRTLCAWVRPFSYPAPAANKNIVRYGTGFNGNFGIFMYNPGTTQRVGIVTVGNDYVDPQYALPLYTWSHFCATYDGNNASVYINGQHLGTVTGYGTSTGAGNLGVGGDGIAIDDVRLYDSPLSQLQIRELALQVPTSLVARYELNNDDGASSNDEWADYSGYGNSITGAGGSAAVAESDRFARLNRAAQLVRTSAQYFSVPDSAHLTPADQITVAAWVKLNSLPSAGQIYTIAAKMATGGVGYSAQIWNDGGNIRLYWWNNGSTGDSWSVPYQLSLGVYHHIAFVRFGTTTNFYVNGALLATAVAATSSGRVNATSPLLIGARNDNLALTALDGSIDDVRIYSRRLVADEIRALVTQPNRRMQLSATTVQGNFGGAMAADALCPTGYKALLNHTDVRRACTTGDCSSGLQENLHWVMRPFITYLRSDGQTPIATANDRGIFSFPLWNSITAGSEHYWTGMADDWTSAAQCGIPVYWSVSTTGTNGIYGRADAINNGFIYNYSILSNYCSESKHILCVEQ